MELDFYVFLDDGETWSSLDGATIVGLAKANEAAETALYDGDWDELFRLADLVVPVAPPAEPTKPRRRRPTATSGS